MPLSPVFGRKLRTLGAAACVFLVGVTLPAHASLIGTSVVATLHSIDLPQDYVDNVVVGPQVEITSAPPVTTNIGANMATQETILPGGAVLTVHEFIDFDAFSVTLRILAGTNGPDPVTGYSAGSMYTFALDPNSEISGIGSVSASAGDITNLSSDAGCSQGVANSCLDTSAGFEKWISFKDQTISVYLDNIVFFDKPGADFADVTIGLTTISPVPEPGSLALAGLALLGLWASCRRRPGAAGAV